MAMKISRPKSGRLAKRRPFPEISQSGMTLPELLVTLALVAFLMAALFSVFSSVSTTFSGQSQVGEVQTGVQIGLNDLVFDLTNAGFNGPERIIRYQKSVGDTGTCPQGKCPLVLLQASDWQITFLADANATSDSGSKDSPAFKFYEYNICTNTDCTSWATTAPAATYHSEVIRWTLDSSGNAIKRTGGTLEFVSTFNPAPNVNCGEDCDTVTPNPNDYILFRESNTNASPDGPDTPYAFGVRGPAASDGSFPTDEAGNPIPLFQYWIDRNDDGSLEGNDCDGVDDGAGVESKLYGDANNNCVLDAGEVPVGNIPADTLRRILRVVVTMRIESRTPSADYSLNNGYRFNIVKSAAMITNQTLYYRQKD